MHPFNMDLTSTILRSIISRHEDSVLRLGAAHKPVRPQFWVQHFQMRGLYSRECSSSIYPPNEALTFFLLPLSYLRAYLIFMGQSSTLFIQFWSSLYLIPFTPPTLGEGTYAIIGRRSHRESCTCNLHTYILLIVKFWSVGRNTLKLPLIEVRTTDINAVDRICIK